MSRKSVIIVVEAVFFSDMLFFRSSRGQWWEWQIRKKYRVGLAHSSEVAIASYMNHANQKSPLDEWRDGSWSVEEVQDRAELLQSVGNVLWYIPRFLDPKMSGRERLDALEGILESWSEPGVAAEVRRRFPRGWTKKMSEAGADFEGAKKIARGYSRAVDFLLFLEEKSSEE